MLDNTLATVFYATPHRGTFITRKLFELFCLPWEEPAKGDVEHEEYPASEILALNSKLQQYHDEGRVRCLSFGEQHKTAVWDLPLGRKLSLVVVPEDTANPGFGEFLSVAEDHLNICKPQSPEDPVFAKLVDFLSTTLDMASLPGPRRKVHKPTMRPYP